jgi:tRNA (guanosine-2'-O-)-methyltransferase
MDAIDRLIEQHGPDLVLEAARPLLTDDRLARIESVLDARLTSVVTVIEDLHDPHNGAAAIRSTEALGLQEFHVIEPNERFAALKGITKGCHRWIDLVRWPDIGGCVAHLRARGFRVLATEPASPVDIDHLDMSSPVAVVFGNEHRGVTAEAAAACDGAVAIPMFGFTESFNLSVAVALVQSRLAERRRAHLGARGDLAAARRTHLRARWAALRLRAAVGVIERYVSERTRPDVAPGTHSGDDAGP